MSAIKELTGLGIAELARRIADREVSPVEAVQASLDRIERLDDHYRAFISVYPEAALVAAREAEAALVAGADLGPLHGVPLAVKDLFQVAGTERTCGSQVFREAVKEDATSVARLRQAGAIMIGLLNLQEFAFGPVGINPHHGTARNPWNPERACGGSSAGSGCAVAASLVPGTLGTDTGGSVRIPASFCGVIGVKQTYGLASRHGIYPLVDGFDHGGPLAWTVRDAAILLQAIAGSDPLDPSTSEARVEDYTTGLEGGIEGLRIGVPKRVFFDDIHPDIETNVRRAIAVLGELGAEVREIDPPFAAEFSDVWNALALPECYAVHETRVIEQGELLSPDVTPRLKLGLDYSAVDYLKARQDQARIRAQMAALLIDVDLIATPTTPLPAVSAESGNLEVEGREIDGRAVLSQFTRLACLTGQPSIAVPCGFTADGLPTSLLLAGKWFEDAALLRAAHAYEQATPWHQRRPPEPGSGL
ncbi:MAG TPA: amidase [Alphaproteobacteria bacterium]|jgi:aspartyl-tRNA(Asn)/glutamyl-tRNA(Gln) amidotransferase subunit A|nr:amidase [Alphaproteobacteria bacterium]